MSSDGAVERLNLEQQPVFLIPRPTPRRASGVGWGTWGGMGAMGAPSEARWHPGYPGGILAED